MNVLKKICEHCGKEFLTRKSDMRFCSLSCKEDHNEDPEEVKKIFRKQKKTEPELPHCLECGTSFTPKTVSSRFCCDKCRWRWYARENRKKKKAALVFTCVNCGRKFEPSNKNNRKFCCKECRANYYKHPGEGRTGTLDKNSEAYKELCRETYRRQVEKMKFVCETCGKEFKSNGISAKFCPECSRQKHIKDSKDRQQKYRKAFETMENFKATVKTKIESMENQIKALTTKVEAYKEVLKDLEDEQLQPVSE